MINIDAKQIFQDKLASSLGLDKYRYIMNQVHQVDVSNDADFQRIFNGFYLIRRNAEWRKCFYAYFETAKAKTPTFAEIITYLYEMTGNLEASFSSKMLATLCEDKPIWDRYVLQNLSLQIEGRTKAEKLQNAIHLYEAIENWYAEFLTTDKAKECIEAFNQTLPDYAGIFDIKKVDTLLWSIR